MKYLLYFLNYMKTHFYIWIERNGIEPYSYCRKLKFSSNKLILRTTNKDRLIIVIVFHNTALCHQMLGSLEEAAIFLETAVLNLEILSLIPEFQLTEVKNHSIYIEGLLRMQLCALFSQLHRHREALYHAQISVRISHFLVRDLIDY